MSRYILDHRLEGEKKRLALMSQLLDPMHRRHIESLGISRDAQVLEVGCGNGSISTWMAEHVAPDGHVVAVDLDLSLVNDVDAPRVEFRKGDIVAAPVNPGRFRFSDGARCSSPRDRREGSHCESGGKSQAGRRDPLN